MNVASVFGAPEAGVDEDDEDRLTVVEERHDRSPLSSSPTAGAVEEQEIEEEEAELDSYVEDLEEDAAFEEMEEETRHAQDYHGSAQPGNCSIQRDWGRNCGQ